MKRFHIVEGFMKAIDIMDEVIKTIRESSSKANAKEKARAAASKDTRSKSRSRIMVTNPNVESTATSV